MTSDWEHPTSHQVALFLSGTVVHSSEGTTSDDDVLLLFNGGPELASFVLAEELQRPWSIALDSADPGRTGRPRKHVDVDGWSVVVLMRPAVTPVR